MYNSMKHHFQILEGKNISPPKIALITEQKLYKFPITNYSDIFRENWRQHILAVLSRCRGP